MSKKATLNVRVDKNIKEKARKLASELGLSLSDVVQINLRTFVRERGISAHAPLKPTKKLEKILEQAQKDIKEGKNLSPVFNNMNDAIAWLEDEEK